MMEYLKYHSFQPFHLSDVVAVMDGSKLGHLKGTGSDIQKATA